MENIDLVVHNEPVPFVLKEKEETPFLLTPDVSESVTFQLEKLEVRGDTSLRGPKGDRGDVAASYVHTQSSADTTWTVNHNLGVKPSSVTPLSPGGVELTAGVLHVSDNQVQVSFVVPVTGSVRITV